MSPTKQIILVIDDDPLHCALASGILADKTGLGIASASSAAEAFTAIHQHGSALALILSDLNMPDMDGVEFMSRLAQQGCSAPIIIVSGANPAIVKSALILGRATGLRMVDAIAKPVDYARLLTIIERSLPARAA